MARHVIERGRGRGGKYCGRIRVIMVVKRSHVENQRRVGLAVPSRRKMNVRVKAQ